MKMKVVPMLLTGMKTKVINHKYRENKLWRQIVADNEVQIVCPHLCEFEGQWLPWFNISYFIDASVQLKIKICTVYFLCFLFEWCQLKHLQCCSFCFSGCFPPSGSPTSIPTPSTYTPHHQQQQPLLQPQTSFLIQQLIFPSLFLCHRLLVSDEEILCPQTKTVH